MSNIKVGVVGPGGLMLDLAKLNMGKVKPVQSCASISELDRREPQFFDLKQLTVEPAKDPREEFEAHLAKEVRKLRGGK